MNRGRPRESEIEKISVTKRKNPSQSPGRGGSLGSLGQGSGLNNPQMPFVDEKLSNINDSIAQIAQVNQSHLENLASVFESINPIKTLKSNIKEMNESLAEIEQQSFNQMPTPTQEKQFQIEQNDDIFRHETPLYKNDVTSPKRKRWDEKIQSDQKSYTFNGSQNKNEVIPAPSQKQKVIDPFEIEFKAWQAQKQQQTRSSVKKRDDNSPKKDEIKVQVISSPARTRGPVTQSDIQTTTNPNMNDISEGYDQSVRSFTGPLNSTLGANPKIINQLNSNQKAGSAVNNAYQDSFNDQHSAQQFTAVVSPPQLHPSNRQMQNDSFASNRSGTRMSPAGRNHKFADGRQSRGSGSRGSGYDGRQEQKELHAVSVVKKSAAIQVRDARDQSLELKMKRMAEDASRAQEAQRQMELKARQKRLQQQEQLLAGFKNSKIDIKKNQQPIYKQVLSDEMADDFGNDDDLNDVNEQSAGGNSYQNQAMTPKVGYHTNQQINGTKSYYGSNDKTVSQSNKARVGIHVINQSNQKRNQPAPASFSEPDVFSDKTQEVMTHQSKQQVYENLYYQVLEEEDPHAALNKIIMRDKKTYDYYKDGLHLISQWIDKELLRRNQTSQVAEKIRLINYGMQKEQQMAEIQRQVELKRKQEEMEQQTFKPQNRKMGTMGSNFAGRKQSQSPARFINGQEEFLQKKEQWVQDQNQQKQEEFESMKRTNYMSSNSKHILRNRENSQTSGASGHGSFLNRNYYDKRGSNAGSNASGNSRSDSRSRGLQEALNRSGERGRFFNPANNSNSKISQNGSNGIDRFSSLYDDAGTRQNQLQETQFESNRKQKDKSEFHTNSDEQLVQALHREFTDSIKTVQNETGNIFLVDVFTQLKFINEEKFRGQETRQGVMLRQQRNNLIVGNQRKSQENEDILKNLFKVCCSIMNLKPIQKSYKPMDQKILSSYLDYLNLQKHDQDVIILDQLATIKSLINRQPYALGSEQILQIHQKFRNFYLNRKITFEQGKMEMQSQRQKQGDDNRGMFQQQVDFKSRKIDEGQQRQQLHNQRPQNNHEFERQKEDSSFKPALNQRSWQGTRPDSRAGSRAGSDAEGRVNGSGVKRPWQGNRPDSRAGSNAEGRINGSGVKRPEPAFHQDPQQLRQRYQGQSLNQMDMQSNQDHESSISMNPQKFQNQPNTMQSDPNSKSSNKPNTKQSDPNSQDENNELRSSYMGARETQKNDASALLHPQNGARVATSSTVPPQALISDEISFNESFGAIGGSTHKQKPPGLSNSSNNPAEISFKDQVTFRQSEPICILNIELDGKNVEQILVYEGEDPRVIVQKFGQQFNLSDKAMAKLLEQIQKQIRLDQQTRYQ